MRPIGSPGSGVGRSAGAVRTGAGAGEAVAVIRIPRIGVDRAVVQGVKRADLRKGPGHYPDTPLPGEIGNAAIAGHRTTYGAPFNRLDELQPGDPITITTVQGTFLYLVDRHEGIDGVVRGHLVIGPNDVSVLEQGTGDRLTLIACHPKYSAAQRIVVTASLSSPAAPSTPIPTYADTVTYDASADALAGGDPSAWPAAIGWGIATVLAWFGVWYAARRWRRFPSWIAYVVGTPVVLALLFLTFANAALLLPASF